MSANIILDEEVKVSAGGGGATVFGGGQIDIATPPITPVTSSFYSDLNQSPGLESSVHRAKAYTAMANSLFGDSTIYKQSDLAHARMELLCAAADSIVGESPSDETCNKIESVAEGLAATVSRTAEVYKQDLQGQKARIVSAFGFVEEREIEVSYSPFEVVVEGSRQVLSNIFFAGEHTAGQTSQGSILVSNDSSIDKQKILRHEELHRLFSHINNRPDFVSIEELKKCTEVTEASNIITKASEFHLHKAWDEVCAYNITGDRWLSASALGIEDMRKSVIAALNENPNLTAQQKHEVLVHAADEQAKLLESIKTYQCVTDLVIERAGAERRNDALGLLLEFGPDSQDELMQLLSVSKSEVIDRVNSNLVEELEEKGGKYKDALDAYLAADEDSRNRGYLEFTIAKLELVLALERASCMGNIGTINVGVGLLENFCRSGMIDYANSFLSESLLGYRANQNGEAVIRQIVNNICDRSAALNTGQLTEVSRDLDERIFSSEYDFESHLSINARIERTKALHLDQPVQGLREVLPFVESGDIAALRGIKASFLSKSDGRTLPIDLACMLLDKTSSIHLGPNDISPSGEYEKFRNLQLLSAVNVGNQNLVDNLRYIRELDNGGVSREVRERSNDARVALDLRLYLTEDILSRVAEGGVYENRDLEALASVLTGPPNINVPEEILSSSSDFQDSLERTRVHLNNLILAHRARNILVDSATSLTSKHETLLELEGGETLAKAIFEAGIELETNDDEEKKFSRAIGHKLDPASDDAGGVVPPLSIAIAYATVAAHLQALKNDTLGPDEKSYYLRLFASLANDQGALGRNLSRLVSRANFRDLKGHGELSDWVALAQTAEPNTHKGFYIYAGLDEACRAEEAKAGGDTELIAAAKRKLDF